MAALIGSFADLWCLAGLLYNEHLEWRKIKTEGVTIVSENNPMLNKHETKGFYFPEIELAILYTGGKVSASFQSEQKTGLYICPLTQYFPVLSTNGRIWLHAEKDITIPVGNQKFAFLYTLLQKRWQAEQNYQTFVNAAASYP